MKKAVIAFPFIALLVSALAVFLFGRHNYTGLSASGITVIIACLAIGFIAMVRFISGRSAAGYKTDSELVEKTVTRLKCDK